MTTITGADANRFQLKAGNPRCSDRKTKQVQILIQIQIYRYIHRYRYRQIYRHRYRCRYRHRYRYRYLGIQIYMTFRYIDIYAICIVFCDTFFVTLETPLLRFISPFSSSPPPIPLPYISTIGQSFSSTYKFHILLFMYIMELQI